MGQGFLGSGGENHHKSTDLWGPFPARQHQPPTRGLPDSSSHWSQVWGWSNCQSHKGSRAGPYCPHLGLCRFPRCGLLELPGREKIFSRPFWRSCCLPLRKSRGPRTHRGCWGPGDDDAVPRALTNTDPPRSAGPHWLSLSLCDTGKPLHCAFCPLAPSWHKFCWALREGNNKTCQGDVILPRRLGHVWEMPVVSGSRRTVWAPGPVANCLWNAAVTHWRPCGWARLTLPFLDVPSLRCAGMWDAECCIHVGFLEVVSLLLGKGRLQDTPPWTVTRTALGTGPVTFCKVSVAIDGHQVQGAPAWLRRGGTEAAGEGICRQRRRRTLQLSERAGSSSMAPQWCRGTPRSAGQRESPEITFMCTGKRPATRGPGPFSRERTVLSANGRPRRPQANG